MGFKAAGVCVLVLAVVLPLVSGIQKRSDDNTYEELEVLIQQQAATIQALQAQVTSLDNKMAKHLNTKVFFTAKVSAGTFPFGSNVNPVKFDNVFVNEGSGYNPSTGHFTAPVSGSYVFYAQLMSFQGTHSIHWGIHSSMGTHLCNSYMESSNTYDKASCLATIKLTAGQAVWVQPEEGLDNTEEGNNIASFSGFLLNAD